jgi:hypothetical protein
VIILSWIAKYNLYYICYEITKDLPFVFSSTLNHGDIVNIITLYTIIFCSDCTRVWTASLHSLRYILMCVALLEAVHLTQSDTFYYRRACSCFSYLAKHDIFVSLWLASVVNVSPPVNSVGPQITNLVLPPEKRHRPWYSPCAIEESSWGRGVLAKSNSVGETMII